MCTDSRVHRQGPRVEEGNQGDEWVEAPGKRPPGEGIVTLFPK